MKRKSNTDKERKSKRINREDTAPFEEREPPVSPQNISTEQESGTPRERSSSFIVDSLSYIASARNSIIRFVTGIMNEQRNIERRERNTQQEEREDEDDTSDRTETESQASYPITQERVREALLPIIYDLRAITMGRRGQRETENDGGEESPAEEPSVSTVMDLFFQNISQQSQSQQAQSEQTQSEQTQNQQSPEQTGPYFIWNIILTITYYIDDAIARPKTIEIEELEKNVPKLEANGTEGECPICLVDIEKDEILCRLQCKHLFHCDCVTEWLTKYSNECPMCRKEAVLKSVDETSK